MIMRDWFWRLVAPRGRPAVWTPLAVLPAMLLILEPTGLDLRLQDMLWIDGASAHWIVDSDDLWPRLLFYRLPRWLVTATGISMLAASVACYWVPRLYRWRRQFLFLTLSIALVPGLVGTLKAVSDVHCPSHLVRYHGDQPYDAIAVRLIDPVTTTTRGRCFPAGHASGGFALLALGWLSRNRRWRFTGWAVGVAAGSVTGGYQMAKGVHFLSHTIATLLLALAVTAWLAGVIWHRNRVP